MFVFRTTLDQEQSKVSALQKENSQLAAQLSALEQENRELRAQLTEAENKESDMPGLTDSMLDSLNQVEGIRHTVLSSFEDISAQSDKITENHRLFAESSESLKQIVNDMSGLNTMMSAMSESIEGLSETADN